MFDNIEETFPDVEFWVLSSKVTEHEIAITRAQLVETFGEDRLVKIHNGFDRYWAAWKR
ncbi:hypothetical protein AHP1_1321 [Aeromonas phage Ahp1_CNU-2021]|nr:hypothetical protein AHP1_1321 [Aeromonas phage Ahp1_CNU-2021]